MSKHHYYTLSASCPDQVGIIANVTSLIAQYSGWILESAFHAEPASGTSTHQYFMRIEIKALETFDICQFQLAFVDLAKKLSMQWRISDSKTKKRVVILASKQEHCIYDLLSRWSSGELNIEIPFVISNHLDLKDFVEWHKIKFIHIPISESQREADFAKVAKALDGENLDAIVLARYMQVLPESICNRYSGKIINIHHSFLPSFVGAKPYHQAFAKGVKLIGATCHYVTQELDQGPIIEQDVIRVDHTDSPDDMVCFGKDIEKVVLSRGLRYHLEDRVHIFSNKTVVLR
jgi:formyltetrahydrofolate deformylase